MVGLEAGTAAHYKRWSRSRRREQLTGPGQKGLPEQRSSRSAWGRTKQQLATCTLPSEPARAPTPEPSNSRSRAAHASPRTPCLTCACHAPSGRQDERGEWCHSSHTPPPPALRARAAAGRRLRLQVPGKREVLSLDGHHCPSRKAPPRPPATSRLSEATGRGCF